MSDEQRHEVLARASELDAECMVDGCGYDPIKVREMALRLAQSEFDMAELHQRFTREPAA